ncbi:MAG: hypothetical protein CUN56_02110 [Phototrophicales bacterium]|nr:MAG: hypothetical protein CUN56_02110 [Phototrophicales bacterium]RMG72496.1 MAG: DinB family protein [Chloroflexota bacterium]
MDIEKIRQHMLNSIHQTLAIYQNLVNTLDQQTATTLRDQNDAPHGWTILEVLCHVRDFDVIFYDRAVMIRDQHNPQLPAYDHEQMAIDRQYNQQNLRQVMVDLQQSRQQFVAFFNALSPQQWERAGIHPEKGHFSLMDALMQVCSHDLTHLEQITRILAGH